MCELLSNNIFGEHTAFKAAAIVEFQAPDFLNSSQVVNFCVKSRQMTTCFVQNGDWEKNIVIWVNNDYVFTEKSDDLKGESKNTAD